KREVDEYYEQLSFVKKIFISRERIYREVDDLVHNTLPRRIEEYLRGAAFVQEATGFLNSTIDNMMQRPLNELIGQLPTEKFATIKHEAAARLVAAMRSPDLARSVVGYLANALERLRPQTLRELLETLNPESPLRLKAFLTNSLLAVLGRDDTARTTNAMLSTQVG